MICPKCGIENPPSAPYCDCGYEFVPGSRPKEAAPPQLQGTRCPKCKTFNPVTNQFCGKCGAAVQKKTSPVTIGCFAVIGLFVLIAVFSSGSGEKSSSPSSSSTSTPAYTPPPEHPESKVSIKKWNWQKGGFDTVMIATFTLSNDNAYAVKDIRIRCELSGNSGTNIDTAEETIYDSIPASTTRTFPDVSMGFVRSQTSRANCEIKSAVRSY